MLYKRKMQQPQIQEAIERYVEEVESVGCNLIELQWVELSKVKHSFIGVEQLKVYEKKGRRGFELNKRWVDDGEVVFYPDTRSRCWGYLVDTEANRIFLARTLKVRKFTIVDQKIKSEIYALAKDNDIDTELRRDDSIDKYLEKDIKFKKIRELEAELKKRDKQLESVKNEAQRNRPLVNVKLDPEKAQILKDKKKGRRLQLNNPYKQKVQL